MKNKFIQTLLIATTVAVMTVSTAFAANYWSIENDEWKYFDKNNTVITNSWAKSNNDWYYVDSNGSLVMNTILEDDDNFYYLDATGAMIRDQWIKSEDDWYYFGSDGKAYRTKKNELTGSNLKNMENRNLLRWRY